MNSFLVATPNPMRVGKIESGTRYYLGSAKLDAGTWKFLRQESRNDRPETLVWLFRERATLCVWSRIQGSFVPGHMSRNLFGFGYRPIFGLPPSTWLADQCR